MPDLPAVPFLMFRSALFSLLVLPVLSLTGGAADSESKAPMKTITPSWDAHVWEPGSVEAFWRPKHTTASAKTPAPAKPTPPAPAPSDFSSRQSGK
jgi:hypothetical protein